MVAGAPGLTGLPVPRGAVVEQKPDGDCVTVQPRLTVVETVLVITLRRDSVTLTSVKYQVNKIKGLEVGKEGREGGEMLCSFNNVRSIT